jgi:hypothetical protein
MEDADLNWRKSTHSGNGGGECVEVARHDGMILVRDTKQRGHGPVHRYTPAAWKAFTTAVRAGKTHPRTPGQQP